MTITFRLESDGAPEALNVSNSNAAALLVLAGLPSMPYGEIPHQQLESFISTLLRASNSEARRARGLTTAVESSRWSEGARNDEYMLRRVGELLEMLVSARRQRCGVIWG